MTLKANFFVRARRRSTSSLIPHPSSLREVFMDERSRLRWTLAERHERQEPPPQLVGVPRRLAELDAGDRLAGADFIAGVAIEHHSRGVVNDVVGFLAAGAE